MIQGISKRTRLNKTYFAYGANMSVKHMKVLCPDAQPVGPYVLRHFKLVFGQHASIAYEDNQKVPGVIWLVSDRCLASLDLFEGYPRYYGREVMYGGPLSCNFQVYKMHQHLLHGTPDDAYISNIMQSYQDWHLVPKTSKIGKVSPEDFQFRGGETFAYHITIAKQYGAIDEIISWCKSEIANEWRWEIIEFVGQDSPGKYVFYFDSERDYLAFVLKWSY